MSKYVVAITSMNKSKDSTFSRQWKSSANKLDSSIFN